MPGYYTHQRIFRDALKQLTDKKRMTPAAASAAALLRSEEYKRAALFGLVGPNIFDYIPRRNRKLIMGHELSFLLHNGKAFDQVHAMLDHLYEFSDKSSYWAAMQRAYFLGYASHLVADAVFHPFMFYWSGFPDSVSRKETTYYREQNLLFQYNMDNYFLYRDERKDDLVTAPEKILPLKHRKGRYTLHPAIKDFILRSIYHSLPDYTSMVMRVKDPERIERFDSLYSWLDVLPRIWVKTSRLQRKLDGRAARFLKDVRMKKLFYSDFIIQYPQPRALNADALNFHRDRWNYPAGKPGFLYESAEDLLRRAVDETIAVWEAVEAANFDPSKRNYPEILQANCYTGVKDTAYQDMKLKSPIRIWE